MNKRLEKIFKTLMKVAGYDESAEMYKKLEEELEEIEKEIKSE